MPTRSAKERWDLRALVAEDDPVARRIAVSMLESLGLTVDAAENGRRAVESATATRYEFILMDFAMPELDGIAATQAIRALPDGAYPKICALTASVHPGHRARCLDAGMDEYFTKPAALAQLKALLGRWFGSGKRASGVRMSRRLDADRIAGLRELARTVGSEAVAEVVQMYLDDAPGQLATLREAVEAGDSEAVGLLAHRLRGSSATMGASAVGEACDALERAEAEERGQCLRVLEVELAGARAQLEAEVRRLLGAEQDTG